MNRSIQLLFLVVFLFLLNGVYGQRTIGLTTYRTGNLNGYVLFSPMGSTATYLIDKCGEKVHEWNSSTHLPALSAYLLKDGSLLRTGQTNNGSFHEGGSGGLIEHFDWDGTLLWTYTISDTNQCLHHDITVLPNGNILCIVWDRYSRQEAVLNGKDSTYSNSDLWSEKILELQPVGTDSAVVVWQWKLWDHLIQDYDSTKLNYGVVSDHPERVNINYANMPIHSSDWIHLNSIDYNPDLDQILLSAHSFNEIWIIDHSTTTAEAASHSGGNSGKGGDLLYRWGNPQAYERGNASIQMFYGQHHATWIPAGYPNAGKILVFNNGAGRPGNFSSIDLIDPPLNSSHTYDVPPTSAFLPTSTFWTYTASTPSDFYSSNISGVYSLLNGSYLITNGTQGLFFEIDSTKQTLWSYINPVTNTGILSQGDSPFHNLVFRCNFYAPDYPGLSGRSLNPQGEIELNPTVPSLCDSLSSSIGVLNRTNQVQVYPNPFSDQIYINLPFQEASTFVLYSLLGQRVFHLIIHHSVTLNTEHLDDGVYFFELQNQEGVISTGKIVKF